MIWSNFAGGENICNILVCRLQFRFLEINFGMDHLMVCIDMLKHLAWSEFSLICDDLRLLKVGFCSLVVVFLCTMLRLKYSCKSLGV